MASTIEVAGASVNGGTTIGQSSGGVATPNAGSHMWANPPPTQEHFIHVPEFFSDYLDSNQPMSQRNDE
eukprot:scaffold34733_cov30-Attheya_sp.AAC.1